MLVPAARPSLVAFPTPVRSPTQAPAWQVSLCVHALASLQLVPLGLAGLLQAPDAGLQTPAVWHWSAAVHTTGFGPKQMPAAHGSVRVQAAPSSLGAPLSLAGVLQAPDGGLQPAAVWHLLASMIRPPSGSTHFPYATPFVSVQALASLQGVPLGLAGLLQAPDAGLQTPAVWHWSAAVHVTGVAPTQAPAAQGSVRVQALPSSHGAPLSLAGMVPAPAAGVVRAAGAGS